MFKVRIHNPEPTGKFVSGNEMEQGKLYRSRNNDGWFYMVFLLEGETAPGVPGILKGACEGQAIRINAAEEKITRTCYRHTLAADQDYEEVKGLVEFATA